MKTKIHKISKLEERLRKIEENPALMLKDWLYENYTVMEKSTDKITRELSRKPYCFNISNTSIATYLKSLGIPRRKGFT